MADIIDPSAIAFTGQVRQLSERVKALKYLVDSAMSEWFSGANTLIGSSAGDYIMDDFSGRELDRLDAATVTSIMGQLSTIQTQLDGSGVMDLFNQASIRGLQNIL